MKRLLIIVAVFLLAGAVVNVAVAWVCTLRWPLKMVASPGSRPPTSAEQRLLADRGVALTTPDDMFVAERRSVGATKLWISTSTDFESVSGEGHGSWKLCSAGWPVRCLGGFVRHHHPRPGTHEYKDLLRVEIRGRHRELPYRPMWLGFTFNTLVYASALWLLFWCALASRRLIRRRRGLCPACAYQRGESEVCSECGKALPGRARVAT